LLTVFKDAFRKADITRALCLYKKTKVEKATTLAEKYFKQDKIILTCMRSTENYKQEKEQHLIIQFHMKKC